MLALGALLLAGVIPAGVAFAQAPALEVTSTQYYGDAIGIFHAAGEVLNTGDVPYEFVRITLTAYDANGQVIRTASTFATMSVIYPGHTSAFDIAFSNSQGLENTAEARYTINADRATDPKPQDLEVEVSSGYTDAIGIYHVVGQVRNNGDQQATFARVSGALYDGQGNLLSTAMSFVDDIPAGGSVAFDIPASVPNISGVARTSFNADSDQYVSVPEFPLPALGLAASLAGLLIWHRRSKG